MSLSLSITSIIWQVDAVVCTSILSASDNVCMLSRVSKAQLVIGIGNACQNISLVVAMAWRASESFLVDSFLARQERKKLELHKAHGKFLAGEEWSYVASPHPQCHATIPLDTLSYSLAGLSYCHCVGTG